MLKHHLHQLLNQAFLTREDAESAMTIILENAEPHQTAAFLGMLKMRGETAEEIAGMVSALEKKAVPVNFDFPVLDIVGTGGDLARTVNISTGSAILAAACGIPIAKHGNRSVSSLSGSADVLEALEIEIEVPPEILLESLREIGIAFMFAPAYHPALKKITPIRQALKLPTFFNILGPLLNPAKAEYALIGAANESTLELMSEVLLAIGSKKRVLLFHGCGLDELTTLGKSYGYDIQQRCKSRIEIDPIALGFKACTLQDLQGGDARLNATILENVFSGQEGAVADALILTAGAAVWVFDRANSLEEGIEIARQALQRGDAMEVLQKWKSLSSRLRAMRKS